MKKLLSILIAVCVLFSLAVIPVSASNLGLINETTTFSVDNLIVNGGFENGLTGWECENPYNYLNVVTSFTDDQSATVTPVNGTKALHIASPAEAAGGAGNPIGYIQQEIDVTANTNYVLTLSWYDLFSTYGKVEVYGDTVAEENRLLTVGNLASGNAWFSSTGKFNSGEHEKLILKISFVSRPGDVTYAIDSITLRAAGKGYVLDFEDGLPDDVHLRNTAYAVSSEKGHDGSSKSLKLTSTAGNSLATISFPINPSRHFSLKFWYYIENGSLEYVTKFAHQNIFPDYKSGAHKTATITTPTGEWTEVVVTNGVTGTGTTGFVDLAIQNYAANTVAYIDDIQIKYYEVSVDSINIANEEATFETLTASDVHYNYGYNLSGSVNYQWQRSADKSSWTDITGATDASYELTSDDAEKYLRVKATTIQPKGYTQVSDYYYSRAVFIGDFVAKCNIVVMDGAGNEVSSLSEITDGTVKVEVSAYNITDKEYVVLDSYYVLYDPTGAVVDIGFSDGEFTPSARNYYWIQNFTGLPADLTGYTYKVFFWDNYDNSPIMKPIIVE